MHMRKFNVILIPWGRIAAKVIFQNFITTMASGTMHKDKNSRVGVSLMISRLNVY